jgi:hypothetical protein
LVQRQLFVGEIHFALVSDRLLRDVRSFFGIVRRGVVVWREFVNPAATDAAIFPLSTAFWSSGVPFCNTTAALATVRFETSPAYS